MLEIYNTWMHISEIFYLQHLKTTFLRELSFLTLLADRCRSWTKGSTNICNDSPNCSPNWLSFFKHLDDLYCVKTNVLSDFTTWQERRREHKKKDKVLKMENISEIYPHIVNFNQVNFHLSRNMFICNLKVKLQELLKCTEKTPFTRHRLGPIKMNKNDRPLT